MRARKVVNPALLSRAPAVHEHLITGTTNDQVPAVRARIKARVSPDLTLRRTNAREPALDRLLCRKRPCLIKVLDELANTQRLRPRLPTRPPLSER
jgi:hypothetical protein